MHILHLIKTSEGAGWAFNLMKEIKNLFPQISFSVAIPLGGRYTNEYKVLCRNVYEFDYQINASIPVRGKKLQQIVKKDNPDIIHSWFVQTTLYARVFLRKYNIPRVFQVVGPLHLENNLFKWCDIASAGKNDYWIATSKYIFDKYKNSGVNERYLFLNYAYVDVVKLLESKSEITIQNLKDKYKIPSHYKIIGTASYIYAPKFYEKIGVKGHEYLLKAFKQILTRRKDVALIIAGSIFGDSSKYEAKLKRMAANIDPNRIFFTGMYKHVYEVISDFDVFVYLSKSENLGGVFESLLFEIPTVASNRGAIPELVISGETGFLVEPDKSITVADTILYALDNKNDIMKSNGKQLVMRNADNDKIINETLEIYNKVMKGKSI